MPTVSLASLIVQQAKADIYDAGLKIAAAVGVPVSTWQPGDPTRSLYHLESETLAVVELTVVGYIRSRFLDLADGNWLKVKADQDYGVTAIEATYATAIDEVLTNDSAKVYVIDPGDLTFKNTLTGKTYKNTTGGTLAAKVGATPGTLTVTVVAEEPGSDSSAGAGEIDDLVDTLNGVTCANTSAAVGLDEEDADSIRSRCRARLARLSPNGPKDAYVDVALDPALTGTSNVTDARSYGDSDTGDVLVYLRGPSGAIAEADRALVEAAILEWATPLCITPTVSSVANVTVAVTYELWIYKSANKTAAEIEADIETALEQMFATRPIGGDIIAPATTGSLYKSLLESTIRGVFPQAFRVVVTAPASDTALTNGQVGALGTVTPTIHIEKDP